MRFLHVAAVVMALLCLRTLPARAAVTEPNDLVVPVNSGVGKQLSTLFTERGEAIDAIQDASDLPETFSPLCDFVATLVLRDSSATLPFGWYNVPAAGAAAPTAADIIDLIPCDAPVNTMITSQSIRSHARYTGGLVGFALLVGRNCQSFAAPISIDQIHYSEKRFNARYQNDPAQAWIMSLKYASSTTPNAFYVAFEDYLATADRWQNDGDFNDYVVFLTGLVCAGGGAPCETGTPGVCGPGVLDCEDGLLRCKSLVSGSDEVCDAADNNCDGTVDEGDLCTDNKICFGGKCVPRCSSGEFPCPATLVCHAATGLCVERACLNRTCSEGEICIAGECKPQCDGIRCPPPHVCRAGVCVDPCADRMCSDKQVCDRGACRPTCTCTPCSDGTVCNETTGLCVEPGCADQNCAAGSYCAAGQCVDSCTNAECPNRQRCERGKCIDDPDAGSSGGSAGSGGGILIDGGTATGGTFGAAGAAGSGNGAGSNATKPPPNDASCGCRAPGSTTSSASWLALLGLIGGSLLRRAITARRRL